jgi:GAF domain-containing protein
MAESFGARLRQQRERQQIELACIAEQTKISLSLLEGLERDDVLRWPAGIFRRSFVRAYARAIGLEPDCVVREFLELYPDPVEVIATPEPALPGAGSESVSQRPPTRLRYLIDRAMALPGAGSESVSQRPPTRLRYLIDRAIRSLSSLRLQQTVPIHESVPMRATDADGDSVKATPPQPVDRSAPDLSAAAHLCTELGRVAETREVEPLLEGAAQILDAVGLIVWVWDPHGDTLRPALAHGYSDELLAQLPRVRRDTNNATATAFRSAQTRVVNSTELASGAIAVPLITPGGCVGVLAVELRHGREQNQAVRAVAMIFAAQLATLFGVAPLAEAVNA